MKTFSRLLRRYLLAAVGIVLLMFVLGTSFLGWVLWREGQRPQREYSYSNIADSMVHGSGKMTLNDQDAATIYIRATTVYDNGAKRTEGAVKSLTVSAAELFDLD